MLCIPHHSRGDTVITSEYSFDHSRIDSYLESVNRRAASCLFITPRIGLCDHRRRLLKHIAQEGVEMRNSRILNVYVVRSIVPLVRIIEWLRIGSESERRYHEVLTANWPDCETSAIRVSWFICGASSRPH